MTKNPYLLLLSIIKEVLPEIKRYFPYLIFILWLSSLVCVLLPECYLERLYLRGFREKEWFGISFIVLSAFIFVIVLSYIRETFKINKVIKEIDIGELNILYQYSYKANINTVGLGGSNPIIDGLEYRGIILKVLTRSNGAYYSINPCFKKALFKHLKKEANKLENMNL